MKWKDKNIHTYQSIFQKNKKYYLKWVRKISLQPFLDGL